MATVKRIICLANSRKLSGRCVAGKELERGQPYKVDCYKLIAAIIERGGGIAI